MDEGGELGLSGEEEVEDGGVSAEDGGIGRSESCCCVHGGSAVDDTDSIRREKLNL